MLMPEPQAIRAQADLLRRQALAAYGRGRYRVAAETAGKAVELCGSTENHKVYACALLMAGDFPRAVKAFRQTSAAMSRDN